MGRQRRGSLLLALTVAVGAGGTFAPPVGAVAVPADVTSGFASAAPAVGAAPSPAVIPLGLASMAAAAGEATTAVPLSAAAVPTRRVQAILSGGERGPIGGVTPIYVPVSPPPAAGPDDAGLARLRACESGGDYGAVGAGGLYRGAYQFDQRTWDGVAAGSRPDLVGVDPASATPADQDQMARALYAARGAAPWPVCGRGL
jgi:hypothetical protein